MKNLTYMMCALMLVGCSSKQQPADEPVAQEEVVATTDELAAEPADDPNTLPAPPDVQGPPPTADSSPSGLAWIILRGGDGGTSPAPTSIIKVHYTGWTTSGEMFDSSVVRGEPIEFPLDKLIAGWIEGIQMMTRGEKRRFWIPAELAYGNSSQPGAPQGLLVFDVELIDFAE